MFNRQSNGPQGKISKPTIDFLQCRKRRDAQVESLRLRRRNDKLGDKRAGHTSADAPPVPFAHAFRVYVELDTKDFAVYADACDALYQAQPERGTVTPQEVHRIVCTAFRAFLCGGSTEYWDHGPTVQLLGAVLPSVDNDETAAIVMEASLSIICDGAERDIRAVCQVLSKYPRPEDLVKSGIATRLCTVLAERMSWQEETIVAAVRCVGISFTSDDTFVTRVLEACPRTLESFCLLLSLPSEKVRREVAWALSNVCAGNRTVLQMVLEANLVPAFLLSVRRRDNLYDEAAERELLWCICNFTSRATQAQIRYLVMHGGVKALGDSLHRHHNAPNATLAFLILEALCNILVAQQSDFDEGTAAHNVALQALDRNMVTGELIEQIAMSSTNERLCQMAGYITTNYLMSAQLGDMDDRDNAAMWAQTTLHLMLLLGDESGTDERQVLLILERLDMALQALSKPSV